MLKRLFDPAKGALFVAARDSGVAFVPTRDPADDFIVEGKFLFDLAVFLSCNA